jgi:hypothetical protein
LVEEGKPHADWKKGFSLEIVAIREKKIKRIYVVK